MTSTYQTSFQSLNLGFMLAAALAWNEAVKFFISRSIRLNRGSPYLFYGSFINHTWLALFTITRKCPNAPQYLNLILCMRSIIGEKYKIKL